MTAAPVANLPLQAPKATPAPDGGTASAAGAVEPGPRGLADVPRIDFGGPAELPPDSLGGDGGPRLVVLYDRDCGLCTATARQLRRWDRHGRLALRALQDARSAGPAGPALIDGLDLATVVRDLPLTAALHVVDEATGQVRAGGAAAFAIGEALPGGRIVRTLGRIPPFRWAVGAGYRVVARFRRPIGRLLRLEGPLCELPQ